MKIQFTEAFPHTLITIAASVVSGALAGAAAGWMYAAVPYQMPFSAPPSRHMSVATSTTTQTPTTVVPKVEVVSVDRKPSEPIVPPAFTSRRVSSVAGIYRRSATSPVLSDAQLLGQAVAVTTDGWFVTAASAIDGMKLGEIVLWHDGVAATATRGILDERSSVVFLKADYTNLTAPAFARYEDITAGVPVWIERRAGSFEPANIALLHGEVGDLKGVPSSVAARRPTVTSLTQVGDVGSPVWDTNGTLIGIASGKPGGTFPFIPSSAWAPSLYGIFSDGKILHADIGVRTVDLASLRLMNRRSDLPLLGAWVVTDQSTKTVIASGVSDATTVLPGDVITRVDRDILDGTADLGEVLVQYKPGSHVTLTVDRAGKILEIPVTLGSLQVSKELK